MGLFSHISHGLSRATRGVSHGISSLRHRGGIFGGRGFFPGGIFRHGIVPRLHIPKPRIPTGIVPGFISRPHVKPAPTKVPVYADNSDDQKSVLSNPVLWVAVAGVAVFAIATRKR